MSSSVCILAHHESLWESNWEILKLINDVETEWILYTVKTAPFHSYCSSLLAFMGMQYNTPYMETAFQITKHFIWSSV